MIDFTMFESRVSNGWEILAGEKEKMRNMNHFHVSVVLAEFFLLMHFVPDDSMLLGFCLLIHLFNFALSMKDYVEHKGWDERNRIRWGYLIVEGVVFIVGGVRKLWVIALLMGVYYFIPLAFYEVQMILKRMTFNERLPIFLRKVSILACITVTFVPYCVLAIILLFDQTIFGPVKLILMLVYLFIVMPLMADFEECEENLFEFAFKMMM